MSPPGPLTITSTVPGAWGGETTVMTSSLTRVTAVPGTPSIGPGEDRWFDPPEEHAWTWERRYDVAGFLDLLGTMSDHLALDAAVRDALFGDVAATVERAGGSFTYGYATRLVLAVRRGR